MRETRYYRNIQNAGKKPNITYTIYTYIYMPFLKAVCGATLVPEIRWRCFSMHETPYTYEAGMKAWKCGAAKKPRRISEGRARNGNGQTGEFQRAGIARDTIYRQIVSSVNARIRPESRVLVSR